MELNEQFMAALSDLVAKKVVEILEKRGVIKGGKCSNASKADKTAYAKTETLLYNYVGFKRIVADRMREIEEIRKYGVPQSCAIKERVQGGSVEKGIVLPEETVEQAVQRLKKSIQTVLDAIALVDGGMEKLKTDPYYNILEMRYFEGRTQEDIAEKYNVSQVTISNNKNRLVRELAMQIFPNQVATEMIK